MPNIVFLALISNHRIENLSNVLMNFRMYLIEVLEFVTDVRTPWSFPYDTR